MSGVQMNELYMAICVKQKNYLYLQRKNQLKTVKIDPA